MPYFPLPDLTLTLIIPAVMIGCLVADVKDVSELAPLLFVPQLLFAGDAMRCGEMRCDEMRCDILD